MKLKYVGREEYIILPNIPNEEGGNGIRVDRNTSFDAPPEEAAELLKVNKQYVKPIFVECTDDLFSEEKPMVAKKMIEPKKLV